MRRCFIVCPIGPDNSDIRKRSDTLFKHIIAPVCEQCGFAPVRIDKENSVGSITDGIINHLLQDDLVIADITDSNANAFYEIGYRAALKKPIIHLMEKNASIPFDVSTVRAISYFLQDLDFVEETKSRLIQTISSMNFDEAKQNTLVTSPKSDTMNTLILQEIYKVQDSIKSLSASIAAKDSSVISVLADKLAVSNSKTPEAAIIETLFNTMINSPEKILKLAEISKQLPTK